MEAISAYSFGSLAWLGLQSAPLLLWPSFISSLLSPEYTPTNAAEIYFARQLGLAQLGVGLLIVVLSGALPLTSAADGPEGSISPFADAVVLVSTLYHAASAFYSYLRFYSSGETGFAFGMAGSSALAAFGLWCVMFAGDEGRRSKRTGVDKRTSGFPFRNAEADKRKGR